MTTLFEKIINRDIPANIIYEDDISIAFHDASPQAPTHILVIPKKPITKLSEASQDDNELLGHLLHTASNLAKKEGLTDYRIIINNGEQAGQTVFHLHVHLLGGRSMSWPPG